MTRLLWVGWALARSALRGLTATPITSAAACITIAVSLVLAGAFALVIANMQSLIERFGRELPVTAYLDGALSEDEQRALTQRAADLPGVESVTWITRDEALRRFRDDLGGADLLEGLEENPLPASLELTLTPDARTPEGLAALRRRISELRGVTELAEGGDWALGYTRVLALVRFAAFGLGGVLVVAALLIVGNTIRLAVFARSDELEILSLVGASRTFVRIPFLIEGSLLGALGGALALATLWLGFSAISVGMSEPLALLLGRGEPRFFDARESGSLLVLGSLLGLAGSAFATLGWRR